MSTNTDKPTIAPNAGYMQLPADKVILDACCGSRMMWFDKMQPNTIFTDKRKGVFVAYGNETIVEPDYQVDFKELPFADNSFHLLVMDPPHSKWLGDNTILGQKYGQLFSNWEIEIKEGFSECMRVTKPFGTVIFKWNDKDIKLNKLLEVLGVQPLFGHTSGKHGRTIWLAFMKLP